MEEEAGTVEEEAGTVEEDATGTWELRRAESKTGRDIAERGTPWQPAA